MKLSKEEIALQSKIEKADELEYISLLREVRTKGYLSLFPFLATQLESIKSEMVLNEIAKLFNDIKDEAAINILADSLENAKSETAKQIITCASWMNGLDFSSRMKTFVEIFINSSYLVAIEALSVIENSVSNCKEEEIDSFIEAIKEAIINEKGDKKPILIELLQSLENIKNAG